MKRIFLISAVLMSAVAMGCAENTYRPPPEPICGNGIKEEGEQCDDGNTDAGDGCSPYCQDEGACGNGVLEFMEQCDGEDLGGLTCKVLGFSSGVLKCTNSCTLDVSDCLMSPANKCGNGLVDPGEECDGDNLNGHTCVTEGFVEGEIRCDAHCMLDTSLCTSEVLSTCGDGVKDSGEECDGSDFGSRTCEGDGFDGGELLCTDQCMVDTAHCYKCGNGIKEGPEQCDGTDLGGLSCLDYGYSGGFLFCAGDCTVDTSSCSNDVAGSCDPFTDAGCSSDEKCIAFPGGDSTCIAKGTGEVGDQCNSSADCGSGLYCIESPTTGLCTKLCHDITDSTYDSQDCGPQSTAACVFGYTNFEYGFCTAGCDLMTNEPCEYPPFTCRVLGEVDRGGTSVMVTDCLDAQECPDGSGNYCGPGQTCVRLPDYSEQCLYWCRKGYGDCSSTEYCESLSPSVVIDGVEWGVCF